MTIYKITPQFINGSVLVPSSKSMGHRMCICAGLSGRNCIVDNIAISKDIEATNRCLEVRAGYCRLWGIRFYAAFFYPVRRSVQQAVYV